MRQFDFLSTDHNDVFLIQKKIFTDHRGDFVKNFNADEFSSFGLCSEFKESYYSYSSKGVLRGMHFQRHPYGHAKLISVIEGEILDVCVCLGERDKRDAGKYYSTILSKENSRSLYIPDGYAHGFLCLSETAIVLNHMTTVYRSDYDDGVHYLSFGFPWPISNPVLSTRDKNLRSLEELIE